MEESSDNDIKMILLGDCGVGKTNIISRYLKNEFKEKEMSSTGANYAMKKIKINGINFNLNLWDTAGQEKFRSVTKMFVQESQIILLCYSIIDHKSFDNLSFWLNLVKDIIGNDFVLGVAGNKSDLYEKEEVQDSEGENFANEHNAIFKLVSAKDNKEGIDLLFNELIKKYIDLKTGNADDNSDEKDNKQQMKINEIIDEKEKKKCC